MNDVALTVCNELTSVDDYCTIENTLLCRFWMEMSEYNQHVCRFNTCCEHI